MAVSHLWLHKFSCVLFSALLGETGSNIQNQHLCYLGDAERNAAHTANLHSHAARERAGAPFNKNTEQSWSVMAHSFNPNTWRGRGKQATGPVRNGAISVLSSSVTFALSILNIFSLANTCMAHYFKWLQAVAHRVPKWYTFEMFSIFTILKRAGIIFLLCNSLHSAVVISLKQIDRVWTCCQRGLCVLNTGDVWYQQGWMDALPFTIYVFCWLATQLIMRTVLLVLIFSEVRNEIFDFALAEEPGFVPNTHVVTHTHR